jgi:hypothetical protein
VSRREGLKISVRVSDLAKKNDVFEGACAYLPESRWPIVQRSRTDSLLYMEWSP